MDTTSRVAHFKTKLEAEWGPFDLEKNKGQVTIVDTRAADAYQAEHIPGAINIPVSEIAGRLAEIPKNKAVVTYCWDIVCHAATRAALTLAEAGYDVKELVGGIDEWKKSERPVEKKELAAAR